MRGEPRFPDDASDFVEPCFARPTALQCGSDQKAAIVNAKQQGVDRRLVVPSSKGQLTKTETSNARPDLAGHRSASEAQHSGIEFFWRYMSSAQVQALALGIGYSTC
jgi:hypothetical protein